MGVLKFKAEYVNNGFIYKNENTFNNDKNSICYIAECTCNEYYDEKENCVVIDEDKIPEEIEKGGLSTYNSMVQDTIDHLKDYKFDDEHIFNEKEDFGFIEKLVACGFDIIDWQCYSTWLYGVDIEEEWAYHKGRLD